MTGFRHHDDRAQNDGLSSFDWHVQESEGAASSCAFTGRILESAPREEGRIWEIVILEEGWSKNGIYWTKECLRQAVEDKLFEGAPINMFGQAPNGERVHLSREARDLRGGEAEGGAIAGLSANVRYQELDGRGQILADYHCTDDQVRRVALAAREAGVPCPLGFSIDGMAHFDEGMAEGRRGIIGYKLNSIYETTIVSRPAAKGRIGRLVAGTEQTTEGENTMNLRKFLEARLRKAGRDAGPVAGWTSKQVAEAVAAHIQESEPAQAPMAKVAAEFLADGKEAEAEKILAPLVEQLEQKDVAQAPPPPSPEPAAAAVAESIADLKGQLNAVQREVDLAKSEARLNAALAASGLPDAAQDNLRSRLVGRVLESEQIASEIDGLRKLLGSLVPASGAVQEGSRIRVGVEMKDRLVAALDLIWDGKVPQGVQESEAHRQAMRNGSPRITEIVALWYDDPRLLGRIGSNAVAQEATTATLQYHLGTSINRRAAQEFQARAREYDDFITVNNDVRDFKLQEILMQGEIGNLPVVAEGDGVGSATYQYGNIGGEERVTASITKFGKRYGLTREMLKNDDMRLLRRLPSQIARAGYLTEKIQVLKGVIGNLGGGGINTDVAYTGQVIYHAHHGNVGALALNYNPLVAALKRQKGIRQWGAKTALTSGINTSVTTIPVTSTVGFEAGQQFRIDGETFTITAIASATSFTVATRSSGASHSSGAAVRQILDQVQILKRCLVVPTELWDLAEELLIPDGKPGTANNDGNVLKKLAGNGGIKPVEFDASFLGGSTTNWYLPVASDDVEFMELGVMDGMRAPEVFLANDQSLATNMLQADQTDYKARKEFYVKVVEARACDGNFPA